MNEPIQVAVSYPGGEVRLIGNWPPFAAFSTAFLEAAEAHPPDLATLSEDGDEVTLALANGHATYHLGPTLAGVREGTLFRSFLVSP